MTTAPLDALTTALDGTGTLVAAVRDGEWSLPTPCSGWDVRALVNHLVGGNRLFARVLNGEPLPPREELGRRAGEDQLGEDPGAAYRSSADQLRAAFAVPGVLDRVVSVPVGDLPGIAALHLRVVETLVHGWDLATATGRPAPFPDELAAAELRFSEDLLQRLPEGRHPFAPSQPVGDDAPALDRLVALLGRSAGTTGRQEP
jgi:uncharacterized protein (TIGR03086 family)